MIALAVYLNRKKLTVGGADDLCVLNAIVNAVGKLGKSAAQIGTRRQPDLWLSVSGLTSRSGGAQDEHLRWISHRRLRIGDKITVQLVRTDRPDKPASASVATRDRSAATRRLRKRGKTNAKAGSPAARKAARR
jgi:hypothetical protein